MKNLSIILLITFVGALFVDACMPCGDDGPCPPCQMYTKVSTIDSYQPYFQAGVSVFIIITLLVSIYFLVKGKNKTE